MSTNVSSGIGNAIRIYNSLGRVGVCPQLIKLLNNDRGDKRIHQIRGAGDGAVDAEHQQGGHRLT